MPRTKTSTRVRPIPVPAHFTMHGSCDYFSEADARTLATIVKRPMRAPAGDLAYNLNFIAEDFLIRYALDRAPTADSKTAEWCEALARDAEALLNVLGTSDQRYPAREMNLQVRTVLTNIGAGLALSEHQYRWMGLGQDAWEMLDRVPAALWGLKKLAQHAASEYRRRIASDRTSSNARQSQNMFLLQAVAQFLKWGFASPLPRLRPSHKGPFIQSVDFVRTRIMERVAAGHQFTNQGTDGDAATRLRSFTPQAAERLWSRERAKILRGVEKLGLMMKRPKP